MLWRNNKNLNIYKILHHATDCTNIRDGAKMVVYCLINRSEQVFVRDEAEFMLKFTKVD